MVELLCSKFLSFFYFKAIERGVHFEICYAPMIRDSTARKNIISNAQSLASVGKGKVCKLKHSKLIC